MVKGERSCNIMFMIKLIKSKLYEALRKSERYTKTDMVYLASGGFWLTASSVISAAVTFVATIVFVNILPKDDFGTYKYVLSFIGILAIPTLMGMGTALSRATARGYEGSFKSMIKMRVLWGVLGTILGLGIAIYYAFNDNFLLAYLFGLVGLFIPLFEPLGMYTSFLQGRKLFGKQSRYDIFSQIVASIVAITTVLLTENLVILVVSYLLTWTILRGFLLGRVIKTLEPNTEEEPGTIKYGIHLSLINILKTIASNIDKILLWHFLGAAQVAIFFLAQTIPIKLNELLRIFPRLAFPKLANQSIDNIKKYFIPKIVKLFLVTIFLIVLYIFAAPIVFKIFFPDYIESINYSRWYSLILLAQPIAMLSTIFSSQSKVKELYKLNMLSPIFKIIALVLLIPPLGIMGAVYAILLSKAFDSILLIFLFYRQSV